MTTEGMELNFNEFIVQVRNTSEGRTHLHTEKFPEDRLSAPRAVFEDSREVVDIVGEVIKGILAKVRGIDL